MYIYSKLCRGQRPLLCEILYIMNPLLCYTPEIYYPVNFSTSYLRKGHL